MAKNKLKDACLYKYIGFVNDLVKQQHLVLSFMINFVLAPVSVAIPIDTEELMSPWLPCLPHAHAEGLGTSATVENIDNAELRCFLPACVWKTVINPHL